MKTIGGIALAGVLALALSGCSAGDSRLQDAYDECAGDTDHGLSVEDGGQTLVFDMKGDDEATGGQFAHLACVLHVLKAPARVTSLMDSTRALDGRQTADWDGIEATWWYHPDSGLDVILTTSV